MHDEPCGHSEGERRQHEHSGPEPKWRAGAREERAVQGADGDVWEGAVAGEETWEERHRDQGGERDQGSGDEGAVAASASPAAANASSATPAVEPPGR